MKIGIFGGSFNPPTIAHIQLAKKLLYEYQIIEKVIFVPVSTKYNKDGLAPDIERYNMLKKVCENNQDLEVSSIELDTEKQLYTIETLNKIQEQNPDKKIAFVLGTDNLKELETWHDIENLLLKYRILVLKRNNDDVVKIINENEILAKHKNSFVKLNIEQIPLSSTEVREKVKNGEDITELVPEEIQEDVKRIYI